MIKKTLLLSSLVFASNAFAVTPTCSYIEKEAKYYGTSDLNGLELLVDDERTVNPNRLKFSDHFSQYLRIENFQSVRMFEYQEEDGLYSFVTTEKRNTGFYKGLTLKVTLKKVSETEYDVMFMRDKYRGEIGSKEVYWPNEHHKYILADSTADRKTPIRYVVTESSLKAKKEFKCKDTVK